MDPTAETPDTTQTAPGVDRPRARGPLRAALGVAAVLLHLVVLWLVMVSGLLAPLWAVLALGAVWLAAGVPLWRSVRDGSLWTLAVPVGVLAVWGLVMTLGDVLLGWSA